MLMIIVGMGAWADELTFSYGDYQSQGTSSTGSAYTMDDKSYVSIADSKFYGNTSYAHFYAGGTITVTPKDDATITKIAITTTSTNYNGYQSSGKFTASTGSVAKNSSNNAIVEWTGNATSSFSIGHDKQIRWTTITVTYSTGGSSDPTPIELNYDDLVGLSNAKTVFYESFDKTAGTGGNDDTWTGSIGASTITYDNNNWTVDNAGGASHCLKLGTGSKKGYAQTPAISATGNFILVFKAAAWGGTDGTTLNLSAVNATLGVSSVTMKNAEFTDYAVMVTNPYSNFKIKFEAKNTSNNRFFLDEVKVIPVTTISVTTAEGYSTFYSDKAIVMPKGLTGSTANVTASNLSWNWEYAEGESVPAGTPILVKGEDGIKAYLAMQSSSEDAAPSSNNLVANTGDSAEDAYVLADDVDAVCYVLGYDKNGENLGFYYYTESGDGDFKVPAGKVFLAVSGGSSVKSSFALDSDSEADAINKIVSKSENSTIFDLSGRRVNNATKGVYIMNGKKYMVK